MINFYQEKISVKEQAIFFSKLIIENENDRLGFLNQYLKTSRFIFKVDN